MNYLNAESAADDIRLTHAYIHRTSSLILIEVDLRHCRASDEVEVVSRPRDWSVISSRCAVSRLVPAFHGDRTIDYAIGITIARLRLCGQPDRVPSSEEVFWMQDDQ